MSASLLLYVAQGPYQQLPSWVAAVIVAVLVATTVVLFYREKYGKTWENGVFPPNFRFSRDHLMEAYIAAAAVFVLKDPKRTAGKLTFINGYLQRIFPDVYYDFKDSYLHSLRSPVSVKSLAFWLNKHLKTPAEKAAIIDFLLDLSWYDDVLNEHEYSALRLFAAELQLDWSVFEEKISVHKRTATGPAVVAPGRKEASFAILGLHPGCRQEVIRATYRKLVKLYHPDKFMQDTAEVREAAQTKFREVKEAYDYLSEISAL